MSPEGIPLHIAAERLLRLKEISLLTGLGRSTIYRLMDEGRFPKQIKPLGNAQQSPAAWKASEVHTWVAERIAGRAA